MAVDPKYVAETCKEIVRVARQYLGSELWLYRASKDNFGKNTNKCNQFVFDVITEAGVTGHVGVVVGARQTASASSREGGKIVINDWGFRAGNVPTFRRYVG